MVFPPEPPSDKNINASLLGEKPQAGRPHQLWASEGRLVTYVSVPYFVTPY